MLSKEEIGNKINLKNKTKYTIEKSKEIIENHKEDNCDCSIETSLAYDMQYVEKYIDQLEKENYNLKVISKAEIEQREQLETDKQKLIETNNKYLQKLVYALTPTTHELSTNNNNAFKKIIVDNIDLETCKIRRKLKEFWGIDKY